MLATRYREMTYWCSRGLTQSEVLIQDLGLITCEMMIYNLKYQLDLAAYLLRNCVAYLRLVTFSGLSDPGYSTNITISTKIYQWRLRNGNKKDNQFILPWNRIIVKAKLVISCCVLCWATSRTWDQAVHSQATPGSKKPFGIKTRLSESNQTCLTV